MEVYNFDNLVPGLRTIADIKHHYDPTNLPNLAMVEGDLIFNFLCIYVWVFIWAGRAFGSTLLCFRGFDLDFESLGVQLVPKGTKIDHVAPKVFENPDIGTPPFRHLETTSFQEHNWA